MITKDGWKLVGSFKWEPADFDTKETCNHCLGRGGGMFDEGDCPECGGKGFRYNVKQRGEQPELPEHLAKWMREAYQEWEELYGAEDEIRRQVCTS